MQYFNEVFEALKNSANSCDIQDLII